MHEAQAAIPVKDRIHRHAAQFEQIYFLLVKFGNRFPDIGQANKGDIVLAPVIDERRWPIRADSQDLGSTRGEILETVPKARQLRATVRSHEAAQEGQYDNLFTAIR